MKRVIAVAHSVARSTTIHARSWHFVGESERIPGYPDLLSAVASVEQVSPRLVAPCESM